MKALRRLLIVLVVLAVLLVGADRVTDHMIERGIENSLADTPGMVVTAPGAPASSGDASNAGASSGDTASTELGVDVEGFPVLTQLLTGELDSLRVRIPAYDVDTGHGTLRVQGIDAHLRGVSTDPSHRTRELRATASVPTTSLAPLVSSAGVPGSFRTSDEGAVLAVEVLGQEATVTLGINPDEGGRTLVLTPVSASVAGFELPSDLVRTLGADLPTISLDALPTGIRVEGIRPGPEGLDLTLVGTDVDFGDFAS